MFLIVATPNRNLWRKQWRRCKDDFKRLKKIIASCFCRHMCNHPQLVDSSHRAVFVSPKKKNVLSCLNIIKLYFCIYEIRLQEDLMIDDIIIVDMTNITFRDMCTLSPRMVLAGVKIYKVYKQSTRGLHLLLRFVLQNTFSMRLRAMYFINSPSYVSIWMPIFKLFFPAKIFDRVGSIFDRFKSIC